MEKRQRQMIIESGEILHSDSSSSIIQIENFSSYFPDIKNNSDDCSESSSSNFEEDNADQRKQNKHKGTKVFPQDYSSTNFKSGSIRKVSTVEPYVIELEPSLINETIEDENTSNEVRSGVQIINGELNNKNAYQEFVSLSVGPTWNSSGANLKQKIFSPQDNSSKKRQRNPLAWKRKKAALLRESGKSYTSYKGKDVKGKFPNYGMLCNNNCPFQCNKKFDRKQRETIFNDFYKLDINGKNAFIFDCISLVGVQRKRKDAVRHKSSSYRYTVKNGSNDIRVCKTAFASLFQIGRGKVDHIQKSLKSGGPPLDHRGRHMNRPHRILPEVTEYIEKHICSFPCEEYHYPGAENVQKKYLPAFLSLRKTFQLYKSKIVEDGKPDHFDVAECTYRHIFTTKFNLSFGPPQNEMYSIERLDNMDEIQISNYPQTFDLQNF